MARQSLGNMLGSVNLAKTPEPEPAPAAVHAVPDVQHHTAATPTKANKVSKPATKEGPAPTPETPPAPVAGPKYLTLERKETRLHDGQLDQLTVLTRRLNKARNGAGERITDNTLIRVAVDLLLDQAGNLAGATENELRKSVGL